MYSGRHSLKDQADFTWHVVEQAADHADDDLAKLLDELVLGHALGDVAHVQPAVLQLDVHLQEGGREQGAKDDPIKAWRKAEGITTSIRRLLTYVPS